MASFVPMNLFLPRQKINVDTEKPVMRFYEDGDWLRIEAQGHPARYLSKKEAAELIRYIGANTVSQKSDLLIIS